jgi:ABC-type nitrate/sulfonate/bicarbonate transport system substrate-binding protein
MRGGDDGGADAIVLTVDRLAALAGMLRDARPKALLLVSRSQGYEALEAVGMDQVPLLRGKRIAVDARSPARFFLLWRLTQARLDPSAIELVPVDSSGEAARLLSESQVDAAAGEVPVLAGAAKERGGRAIASTADAPHLLASVLVARGDFLIRYPDAARRLARAVLEQAEQLRANPLEGARELSTHVKEVGDPFEALRLDPPATFAENLAFFGLKGDIPVGYSELYTSANAVWSKLGEPADEPDATAPVELAPLRAAIAHPPSTPPKSAQRAPDALKPPENLKASASDELLDISMEPAEAADGAERASGR